MISSFTMRRKTSPVFTRHRSLHIYRSSFRKREKERERRTMTFNLLLLFLSLYLPLFSLRDEIHVLLPKFDPLSRDRIFLSHGHSRLVSWSFCTANISLLRVFLFFFSSCCRRNKLVSLRHPEVMVVVSPRRTKKRSKKEERLVARSMSWCESARGRGKMSRRSPFYSPVTNSPRALS